MEGMHDLAHFRTNFEQIAARLATRGNAPSLDTFRELDRRRRSAITQTEQLKARVNERSSEIGKRRREGADTTEQQEQVRALKAEIAALRLDSGFAKPKRKTLATAAEQASTWWLGHSASTAS